MRTRLFLAAFLASTAALAAPGRLGLYPLALPAGQEQLADRLAAQLHEGAAALPGVRAFDLIAGGSCAPDEATCLGAVARRADLDAILTAEVAATASGYRWRLREVSAGGELLREAHGETRGGPLDLAGDLERGVCEAAAAGRCDGEIRVVGDSSVAVFVDGVDRGTPPLSVRVPVGRHLVSAAGDERRVRVSYARTTRLSFTTDGPALAEGDPPARVPRMAVSAAPEIELRSRAARTLFGAGFGLLAVAAGVGLYATAAHSHSAAVAAQATAVGGAAAFLSGGLVVALTPAGAVMQGSF